MVDGKSDARGGGDVGGICDFLEVGLDGNGEGEEKMVDDIQRACDGRVVYQCVGGKNDDQS